MKFISSRRATIMTTGTDINTTKPRNPHDERRNGGGCATVRAPRRTTLIRADGAYLSANSRRTGPTARDSKDASTVQERSVTAWRIALTGSHAPVGIGRVGHLSEQSDRSRPEVRSRRRGPGFTTNGTVIRSGCDRVERVETGPVGRCATQPETSRSLWFPRDTGAGLRTLASAVAEHPRRIRCEQSSRRTGNVHESASRSLSARGGFWDYGSWDGG